MPVAGNRAKRIKLDFKEFAQPVQGDRKVEIMDMNPVSPYFRIYHMAEASAITETKENRTKRIFQMILRNFIGMIHLDY